MAGLRRSVVLGLAGSADERAPVLALQLARSSRIMHSQVLAQAAAALATLWLLRPIVPIAHLLLWFLGVAGTLTWGLRSARAFEGPGAEAARLRDRLRFASALLANALIWALPAWAFGAGMGGTGRLEMWTIIAMLMAVWAMVVPALPQAAVQFAVIAGGATVLGFLRAGDVTMAGNASLYAVIVALGAVQASRDYLLSRLAEAGMAEQREVVSLLLREFEDDGADWLWETDAHRRVRAVSRRFAVSLGLEPGEIEGKSLIKLIAGGGWSADAIHPSLHELADRLTRHDAFANLVVQANVGGETRWWELSGKPRRDEAGAFLGFRGVGSDVTAQRASSDKIAWLARYDTLTGLPNRMMLTDAIATAMRGAEAGGKRCAFLMIDLDRFKAVNDTLGHHIGDHLLAAVSERLQALMGQTETCGRLGGDEFAVVIHDVAGLEHIDTLARAVIARLSEPYTVDNHVLYVGASVGSAVGPRDGDTVEMLMRNADLALYRAKAGGGGRHCTYEPGLHAQAEERRLIEVSLRDAIARNELSLHYQPVVSADDERVVSFEALVRWYSPQHGLISPARFVPVAEDTRLIVPIGEWVLRTACAEAMNWPAPVRVAVNVSAEQLLDPGFLDTLVAVLSSTGLPPQRLEIEVTEGIFLRDATTVRNVLERALKLGCEIALDDFGTGFSSLGYLRTLRFSTIKVDQSFVKGGATGNPESLAVIRAVVAMADSLEISTTAEGVETEEELALVRRLGCRKIQGFYYGRPMPAVDVAALFARQAAARG